MTRSEARALARMYPTAAVFVCLVDSWSNGGPHEGDLVTFAGVGTCTCCVSVEVVAPGRGQRRAFSARQGWYMSPSDLRPLNAAARLALAQVKP